MCGSEDCGDQGETQRWSLESNDLKSRGKEMLIKPYETVLINTTQRCKLEF